MQVMLTLASVKRYIYIKDYNRMIPSCGFYANSNLPPIRFEPEDGGAGGEIISPTNDFARQWSLIPKKKIKNDKYKVLEHKKEIFQKKTLTHDQYGYKD